MTPANSGNFPRASRARRTLSREERIHQILKIAKKQLARSGSGSATLAALPKVPAVPEIMLDSGRKQKLLERAVERNSQERLSELRNRLASIPPLPPIERIERMAEATVLACVEETGNASVMLRGLMELPESAADVYRAEVGATEALWLNEIATHLVAGPLRTRIAVHLAPFAVHACSPSACGWLPCGIGRQPRRGTRANMPRH